MSGRRNERARERHRYELKKNFSLTSVPQEELDIPGGPIGRKLSLSNHFGWIVISKSRLGDIAFPHLSEFYEKPDPEGRAFQKITYVLFMDKGAVIDKKMEIKQTQTSVTGAEGEPQQVFRESLKEQHKIQTLESAEEEETVRRSPKDRRKIGEKKRKSRGRYLISEFYFVPKENRSLSRSTKATSGDESETGSEKIKKEKRRPRSRSSHKSSRSRSKASSGAGSKGRKKKSKKRGGPDKWQLRAPAGADNVECSTESEYTEEETENTLKTIQPLRTVAIKAENQYSQVRQAGQARKQKSRI